MTPSVRHGSTSDAGPLYPDGGNQRTRTAKIRISMIASQKFGNDNPSRLPTRIRKSASASRCIAAYVPSGNATASATAIPPTASASVAPARAAISADTGSPLRNDVPRSPRSAGERRVLHEERPVRAQRLMHALHVLDARRPRALEHGHRGVAGQPDPERHEQRNRRQDGGGPAGPGGDKPGHRAATSPRRRVTARGHPAAP